MVMTLKFCEVLFFLEFFHGLWFNPWFSKPWAWAKGLPRVEAFESKKDRSTLTANVFLGRKVPTPNPTKSMRFKQQHTKERSSQNGPSFQKDEQFGLGFE